MEMNDIRTGIDKIEDLLSVELSEIETDMINKWYECNPYCTHAAYLSMIENLKSMKMNELLEKRRLFFNSLPGQVFEFTKGFTTTFYVFDECDFTYTNYDGWNCDTIAFDVVGNCITSYRVGKMYVTMENCSMFENMKRSNASAIDEMSKRIYQDIKNMGF